MNIYPPPLVTGDLIGVMAPSSYVDQAAVENAAAIMEARGFRVFIHPQTFTRENQSAGSASQKAAAFRELWDHDEVKVIWAAGGGNRCLHWLDKIDYAHLRATPKTVVGFSDVTALLNALYARAGIVSIHGPVLSKLHAYAEVDALLALLAGHGGVMSLESAHVIQPGIAEGVLVGGNLSLFQYLPEQLGLDFCDGAILFLEDCSEELSRIDRMLLHLRRTGTLDRCGGLILGQFTDIKESGRPFGFTLEDLVREHIQGLDIPVVMNAPFGHGPVLYPLPVGGYGRLDTSKKSFSLREMHK